MTTARGCLRYLPGHEPPGLCQAVMEAEGGCRTEWGTEHKCLDPGIISIGEGTSPRGRLGKEFTKTLLRTTTHKSA